MNVHDSFLNLKNKFYERKKGAPPHYFTHFFSYHQGRLRWRSLLKDELLGELKGFFYGLHPAITTKVVDKYSFYDQF